MNFQDLIQLYEEKKKKYGEETYRYVSEILREAKEKHKKDFNRIAQTGYWKIKLASYKITCDIKVYYQ